ncbi:hypothetical protein [Sporolactobacillus terrae]|uniref:hypothetical protein n=1 Tax=Sporolactobacillus terrae TaxID=269673 RepID=UPI00048C0C82|nr:hypothetical protein [Sporolactobacillus terrae]
MGKMINLLTTIPVAFITTIITIMATNVKDYIKDTTTKRKYAAILYYDMNDSIEMLTAENVKGVFKNQFTFIDKNKIYDYLLSIRGIVSEDSFKNIKVYYKNIFLLENAWKKYWDSKDQKQIKLLEKDYFSTLNVLKSIYTNDELGFKDTINRLKEIAKIK